MKYNGRHIPIIPVELKKGEEWIVFDAYVDSGQQIKCIMNRYERKKNERASGGGRQLICEDISELNYLVVAIENREELGEKGYEFAKDFTVERFEDGWGRVLSV